MANGDIKIEPVVGAETDTAWIIGIYPTDKDKAVATDPAQALFILANKMGFGDKVTLDGCYNLVGIGRRAAINATKAKG